MKLLLLSLTGTMVLTGCRPASSNEVNPFKGDAKAVNFTSTCSVEVNGQCNQYTCDSKTNETGPGDCSGFANGCVKGGNHYSGTAEGGKCTRVL